MARVLRFDAGSLQKPRRTSQGYLRVDGWAARAGTQEYRNPDGSKRIELRDDDAVFADDALQGFEGAPVTDDHPPVMVDLANAKSYTKGTVLSVGRRDGDHVAVSLVITDPDLIRKVEAGKRQLSTGYYVELDETPGVHPKYGRFDARQVRVGPVNHLALVERGRAGTAAVRMDAAVCERLDYITHEGQKWVVHAEDGRVLGTHDSETDALAQLRAVEASKHSRGDDLSHANRVPYSDSRMDLEAALARIKELETKLDAYEAAQAGPKCETCGETMGEDHKCAPKMDAAEVAKLEAERDTARKDAEDAKTAAQTAAEAHAAELAKVRKDAEESAAKMVRESLDVLSKARAILGKDAKIKLDGKDVDLLDAPLRAVKCAVVKHAAGKTIDAKKHDAYVEALFEDAVEKFSTGANSAAAARAAIESPRKDEVETPVVPVDPEKAALEANKNRISSAWMAETSK